MRKDLVTPVLLLLALTGCRSQSAPGGVVVSAAVSSALIAPGTGTVITVTVTNLDDRPHGIQLNSCPASFEVTTPDGKQVAPGPLICTMISIVRDLAPGEQHVFTYAWDGRRKNDVAWEPSVPLSPGVYLVRGLVHVIGTTRLTKSAPVPVTITD